MCKYVEIQLLYNYYRLYTSPVDGTLQKLSHGNTFQDGIVQLRNS
jgi:hypothetical protein